MACFSDLLNDGLLSRRPVFGKGQTVHTIFHQLVFEEVPLRVSGMQVCQENVRDPRARQPWDASQVRFMESLLVGGWQVLRVRSKTFLLFWWVPEPTGGEDVACLPGGTLSSAKNVPMFISPTPERLESLLLQDLEQWGRRAFRRWRETMPCFSGLVVTGRSAG